MVRIFADSHKALIVSASVSITMVAVLARFAHLFKGDHYHILSSDSYYFLHLLRIDDPPLYHKGLIAPISWLSNLTGEYLSCLLLPVFVGLLLVLLCCYGCYRIYYSKGTAFLSAIVCALLPHAIVISAAGFIDRDGLNVLLISAGLLVFWLYRDKPLYLCAGGVIVVSILIELNWVYVGRWILLFLLLCVMFGMAYERRGRRLPWLAFGIVVAFNVGFEVASPFLDRADNIADIATRQHAGSGSYSEFETLNIVQLIWYGFFALPIVGGAFVAYTRRLPGDIFILSWALGALAMSVLSARCLIFFIVPAVILASVGLYEFVNVFKRNKPPNWLWRAMVTTIVVVAIVPSFLTAYRLGDFRGMSPDKDYQAALEYIKNNTPGDSTVINHWDYGYYILALAERTPVAMGGNSEAYIYDDIASNSANLVKHMETTGANYAMLDTRDADRNRFNILFASGTVFITDGLNDNNTRYGAVR